MILVVGLTPAWQQILEFDAFAPGGVHRARSATWTASGKAVNAALALHTLGAKVRLLSPFGGRVGELLRADLDAFGVATRWIPTKNSTRVCTTIVEPGRTTELVENASEMSPAELTRLRAAFDEEARSASALLLCGSLTPGAPTTFYQDLCTNFPGPVFLDARGPELSAALACRPKLVKPNREELARTVGRPIVDDVDLGQAMESLRQRGAEWVVVTDGPNPIHARGPTGAYRLQSPTVPIVNAIGCGDCMTAGIAWAVVNGATMHDALRLGVAASVDNLRQLLPARLDADRVRDLASHVFEM